MTKKRTYRTVPVQSVQLEALLSAIAGPVVLAFDIAKEAMVFAVADVAGKAHALVRFSHPNETAVFLALLERLLELRREVQAVMEPTGTYGDALRYQLRKRGVPVFRVDAKRCHDMRAVLDGVDGITDPKACTVIAALHAQALTTPWRERTELEEEARALGEELAMVADPLAILYRRVEAILAGSWPELGELFDQRARWPLQLLLKYPSPEEVAAHEREARELLRRVGRGALSRDTIDEVLRSAKQTVGAPLPAPRRRLLQEIVEEMLHLHPRVDEVEKRMKALCRKADDAEPTAMPTGDDAKDAKGSLVSMADTVGPALSLAIFADLGSPAGYGSAAALEKAAGLNLREVSSGKREGQLRITKRGPARVRALLYLAALRLIRLSPLTRAWYERRDAPRGTKKRAVVAVMRKLIRALFHVARGAPFRAELLFDARKLEPSKSSSKEASRAA